MIGSIAALDSLVGSISGTAAVDGNAAKVAPGANVSGPSFSEIFSEVAGGAASSLRAGETAAVAGIQGNATVQEVVNSIMSAEQALQTALAVRDKVVAAYQEISRMAI